MFLLYLVKPPGVSNWYVVHVVPTWGMKNYIVGVVCCR